MHDPFALLETRRQFLGTGGTGVGLAALAGALEGRGFQWIDAKRLTPELAADGFDGASRMDYLARLKRALAVEQIGAWSAPPIKDAA